MKSFKKAVLNYRDQLLLIKNHKKDYATYYSKDKATIYKLLKDNEIYNIKPVHRDIWKLAYNTSYYIGKHYDKLVFIKVMGELLRDCYYNEIVVNKYIEEKSSLINARTPKLIDYFEKDHIYVMIMEYIPLEEVSFSEVYEDVAKVLEEYSRVGIIHTDFGLTNMGINNGKYFFIDYGTSLCKESNNIRIRNNSLYNHIGKISDFAKQICPDAEFYYDDYIHFGLSEIESDRNFIVGTHNKYYAKLGQDIISYHLSFNGDVELLVKE